MNKNVQKDVPKKPEPQPNGRYGCPHCKVTLDDFTHHCPVCGQRITWSEIFKSRSEKLEKPKRSNQKSELSKFIPYWFEIVKMCMYIFIGVIPGIVFKTYAAPGETYDCIYSLIIWGVLLISELGQVSVTAYSQLQKEKNDEDKREG